jgi:hypothetical protein
MDRPAPTRSRGTPFACWQPLIQPPGAALSAGPDWDPGSAVPQDVRFGLATLLVAGFGGRRVVCGQGCGAAKELQFEGADYVARHGVIKRKLA